MNEFKFFHPGYDRRMDQNAFWNTLMERIQPESTFRMIIKVMKEEDLTGYC